MFKLQGNRQQSTKIQMLCMPLLLASQMHRLREGFSTSTVEMPHLLHPSSNCPYSPPAYASHQLAPHPFPETTSDQPYPNFVQDFAKS